MLFENNDDTRLTSFGFTLDVMPIKGVKRVGKKHVNRSSDDMETSWWLQEPVPRSSCVTFLLVVSTDWHVR